MNIQEIRKKYPQYSDLSDEQLAQGLHKKFYADLPFNVFAGKIGFGAQKQAAPIVSPEEMLTPPPAAAAGPVVKPGGFQAELLPEQFKAGVSGLQEGYYANTAKNNAALLNLMDRIDRGEQIRPIDDVLGYADMDAETKKKTRDAIQSALTGTVAKTIAYGAEREGFKRNENADLMVSLADKGDLSSAFKVFTQDPVGIIQQLSVESAPNALPSLIGGAAGVLLKGGVAGLMTGLATGSFPVEYMASITDSLRESGVDLKDAKAVDAKLRDPKFIEEAGKRAMTRGTVIAAADAASGKLLMPFKAGQLGKNAARGVANIGTETGLEMAGEAGAQIASGEELKLGQVIAEGLGAGPQAAVSTALRTISEGGKPPEAPAKERAEPTIEPPVVPEAEKPAAAVAPAFAEEEVEGAAPAEPKAPVAEAKADEAEISRLEADLAKVQQRQLDPTLSLDDPRLEEFQRQEADIKAKLAEARGETTTVDLYDQLIKATPAELKTIDIPTAQAPDLYLRASEDENASPALVKRLTKIVNEMKPEEFEKPVKPAKPVKQKREITKPQGLTVKFGDKSFPVASIDDAQEKWIEFRDQTGAGVSEIGNGVNIIDQDGNFVARISYNGRVWDSPYDDAKVIKEAPVAEIPAAEPTPVEVKPTKPVKKPAVAVADEQAAKNRDRQAAQQEMADAAKRELEIGKIGGELDGPIKTINKFKVYKVRLGPNEVAWRVQSPFNRAMNRIGEGDSFHSSTGTAKDKAQGSEPLTPEQFSNYKKSREATEQLPPVAPEFKEEPSIEEKAPAKVPSFYMDLLPAAGYERLDRDSPRTYKDKAGQKFLTFEKDGVRVAFESNTLLYADERGRVGRYSGADASSPAGADSVFHALIVDPKERKKGKATKTVQEIVKMADESNTNLYIEPASLDTEGMTTPQLKAFYRRFGFRPQKAQPVTDKVMTRMAREEPVEEAIEAPIKKEEHVEGGESEPITKPVIQKAVTKGAVKKDIDYTAMKREIERQVDEAIAKSPYKTEKDWEATYKSRQNFVTFDIPGDGKFKVKNNVERLEEFKKRLMAAVKPKVGRGPQFGIAPADVNTTLRDLVDSNEMEAALSFAELKGIKISESKLDLKQKLKVKEYIEDPDAFNKKVEEEAKLTEGQRQAMARAEEERRIATNKRLAEEQEKRDRDWVNARYEDLKTGSQRTIKEVLRVMTKDGANKILDKIDVSGEVFPEEIIEALQKKAGTYIDDRWKGFANKIDSPAEAAKVRKKLFEKYATKEGSISLHELVEREVDGGSRIITMESGERRLGDEKGYLSEKKIGTVGMDYAGYLLSQKVKEKPAKVAELTDEQKENAETHANEVGGEVVFQKGDYALIRGYSMMTGDPVYVPTSKTQRGRVDVEKFTGTQIPSEIKQEMVMFKRQAERDAEEKHKTNPFIKFDRGLAMSSDIPENLAGVIRGWKDLLKLDVPVYVSTIQDAKKNRNNFTGPHRRIGSGTLDEKERGSMRRMADGSYYILFENAASPTLMMEVIAHEMGHLHERLVYEKATPEQKAALQKAHKDWLSRQEGKMAKDLVLALRGRATGRIAKVPADQTVYQMSSYWKSFGEWYADQVSRWAVTGKAPVTIVERFFKRLANQLRNFYQKLKNAKYLPDETFVEYIEQVTQKPANLAPGETVIDDTPELMKDIDTDETRKVDELLAKYNRPEAPLHPSDSIKDRLLNTYRNGKKIRDRIEDEGLVGLGKGVISGADRAITYARNKNVWYGTGLDQADFSRYNGQLRDSQGKAVASIAVTNAIHAGHVGTQVMVQGSLEYNQKTKQFMAKKSDKSMANVLKEKAKLVDQLGAQRAANVIQAYFEAKRSRSIVNEYLERQQRYEEAVDSGVDPEEAANDLANIERAMSKVNMDDEQIDEFIALEKEYPELRVMMDNWTAVNHNQLDMSYFAGNLSKARYEQLKSIKDYVPWYRIMDDQTDPHDFPTGGTTKTMTNVAREKRFKAGEVGLDIDDIVDNMIHNVMWMTKNTMRNYAANRVADEYGIRNEKGKLKVFPKEGTDSQGVKFNILRNGRRIVVGIEDPLIAEAVIGMENVEIPMNKILSIMANGLRRSITLSGAFQLKQLFMDAPTAAWVSGVKNPFAVWGNTFIAFGKVLVDKDPIAQKLRQAGIGGFQSTARTPEKELSLEIGLLNKSMYARALRILDHIGDASDYAQRVAIYKQVLKETGDEAQALLQANNVIDFLKRGSGQTAQFLGRTVAFMNAYAQSIDVLATTLAGGQLRGMERKKAITRMAITGTLLSFTTLLYCFAVGDDDEYDKLDDKTKLRNFIIPGSKKYFGETVALPMHTSASFFFKAIPELLYNRFIKDGANNQMDSRRFSKGLWEAFKDAMLGPNVVPTGAKPFIEIGLNKNFWTGTEVIPKGMEDLVAAEQYNAATSELGKIVSAMTSIPGTDDKRLLAPVEADHLMRGLFGSAAAMAIWGTNMLAGDRAESRVKDIPVIGSFVLPPIPRGREDLFYDLKEATDEKYKTYMSMMKREKFDEADKFLEKNAGLIGLHDYTSDVEAALKEINAEIRRIGTTSAKDMSPKERRTQMDEYGKLKGDILEGIESLRKEAFD